MLWKLDKVMNPTRRGFIWMTLGAIGSPSNALPMWGSVSWGVSILINDSWDMWIWEFARKASANPKVRTVMARKIRESPFHTKDVEMSDTSDDWIMNWLHTNFELQALEIRRRASEEFKKLPWELQERIMREWWQITIETDLAYTIWNIADYPDGDYSDTDNQNVDLAMLAHYIPDLSVWDIDIQTLVEFSEGGFEFYFEIYRKVKWWKISAAFYESDLWKVLNILNGRYDLLENILDEEWDLVHEEDSISHKKGINKLKNSTALTPTDFIKKRTSQRVIDKLEPLPSNVWCVYETVKNI